MSTEGTIVSGELTSQIGTIKIAIHSEQIRKTSFKLKEAAKFLTFKNSKRFEKNFRLKFLGMDDIRVLIDLKSIKVPVTTRSLFLLLNKYSE